MIHLIVRDFQDISELETTFWTRNLEDSDSDIDASEEDGMEAHAINVLPAEFQVWFSNRNFHVPADSFSYGDTVYYCQ